MKNALLWFSLIAFFSAVTARSDYFSDISEDDYKKLQEIARFLRNQVEEADSAEEGPPGDSSPEVEIKSQSLKPPFNYNPATVNPEDGSPPFAVGPSDPRYYQDFGTPFTSTNGFSQSVSDSKTKRLKTDTPKETGEVDLFSDDYNTAPSVRQAPIEDLSSEFDAGDGAFIALIVLSSAAGIVTLVAIAFGCYRLQKNAKAAADVDYPAYGITGPNKDTSPASGDRRLAQSAQMYHYQHQKQQIIAMESMSSKERRSSISDAESEEENEEGDYTVYECPGLAPTGEMEVKNPLFQDDQTPAPKSANDEDSREHPNLISFD